MLTPISDDIRVGLSELHEATQVALDCADPAFKVYLHEVHGMPAPLTDDHAVSWVLALLEIRSVTEIRAKTAARERWSRWQHDFKTWRLT